MKFRKLRVAFSATCLVGCVLLVALWARSYSRYYSIEIYRAPTGLLISTQNGTVALYRFPYSLNNKIGYSSSAVGPNDWMSETYGVRYFHSAGESIAFIQYGLLTAPLATLAALFALPWLGWRFSVRTLLIVTTLLALLLGHIVYMNRQ